MNAHVIFADTVLPEGIVVAGWRVMGGNYTSTTSVGEFQTSGPGASQSGRVAWAKKFTSVLTTEEWLKASGSTAWLMTPRY